MKQTNWSFRQQLDINSEKALYWYGRSLVKLFSQTALKMNVNWLTPLPQAGGVEPQGKNMNPSRSRFNSISLSSPDRLSFLCLANAKPWLSTSRVSAIFIFTRCDFFP